MRDVAFTLFLFSALLTHQFDVDWEIVFKGTIDIEANAIYNGQKMIVLDTIYNLNGNAIYASLFSTGNNAIIGCNFIDSKQPIYKVKKIPKYIKSFNFITYNEGYIVTDGLEFIKVSEILRNDTTEVSIISPTGVFNKDDRRCIFPSKVNDHMYIIENATLYYVKYSIGDNSAFEIVNRTSIPYNYSAQCSSMQIYEASNYMVMFEKIGRDYYLQIVDYTTMTNKSSKMPIDFEISADSGDFYKIIRKGNALLLKGMRRLYYIDISLDSMVFYDLNASCNAFLPIYDDNYIVGKDIETFELEVINIENPALPQTLFKEDIDENYFTSQLFQDIAHKYIIMAGTQKAKIYELIMIDYREKVQSVKILIISALILLFISLVFIAFVCILKFKKERDIKKNPTKAISSKPKKASETMVTEEAIDAMAMDSWKFAIICPLSKKVMKDPVFLCDGYTYERKVIEDWLKSNDVSPTTNIPLKTKQVWSNAVITNFVKKNVSGK